MLKTVRQFNILFICAVVTLGLGLGLILLIGDTASSRLFIPMFAFLEEGSGGLPQIAVTFDKSNLPERNSAEAAFEVEPAITGDLSWSNTTLLFTPSVPLQNSTEYRVKIRGGLRLLSGGRTSYDAISWSFHTRPLRLAFLKREGRAVNLWLYDTGSGNATSLTNERERQVLDFSVSPGGERIAYNLQEADGRKISLWSLKVSDGQQTKNIQLVNESNIKALNPRWSPRGDLIAYERRIVLDNGDFGSSQLWLVRADGTSLPPLYGGAGRTGTNMSWSTGGDQAFFWEPNKEALGVFNFNNEPSWNPIAGLRLESLMPSPDGQDLMLARYDYSGAKEQEVLWRLSVKSSPNDSWLPSPVQVSRAPGYNDRLPDWSPDGNFVAFIRQEANSSQGTRLMLFETQTGKVTPLLDQSSSGQFNDWTHQWSPDNQIILFERYPKGSRSASESSEIWQIGVDGKNLHRLITGGFSPKWVS